MTISARTGQGQAHNVLTIAHKRHVQLAQAGRVLARAGLVVSLWTTKRAIANVII